MSSRMGRRLLLLIVAAMVLPAVLARAQDQPELARRVDAAVKRREKAKNALTAYRRDVSALRVYPDTIGIADGALVVVTAHEFLPVVRAAAAHADSVLRQRAGSADTLLRGTVLAVRTDSIHRTQGVLAVVQRTTIMETGERYEPANAEAVARALVDYAQAVLLTRGSPTLANWLAAPLPTDTATDAVWNLVRLQLVTSSASVTHRCYAGDLNACKVMLALIPEPDPATAWYDSATRRAIVVDRRRSAILDRVATDRCIAGSDKDCTDLLRTSGYLSAWLAAPGSGSARVALVQQALVVGGPGVLQRLMANGTSPSDRLGVAAKVPVDTLVAQWLRNVRTRGVVSKTLTPGIALVAIGWILAIGALSLRSTRWR